MSEVSRTLNAGSMGRQDWETETLIPTNGGGFDAVAVRTANTSANGHGVAENVAHTIDQAQGQAIAFVHQAGGTQTTLGYDPDSRTSPTLAKCQTPAVAFPINTQIAMRHEAMGESTGMGIGTENDPAFTLQSAHSHAVAVNIYGGNKRPDRPEGGFYVKEEATSKTLDSVSGLNPTAAQGGTAVMSAMQVRRLTPRECERLQGFPDDYTLVQHRNKPAADGPRYKALGNSMAVPVMAWIGRRIAMVEQLKGDSPHD